MHRPHIGDAGATPGTDAAAGTAQGAAVAGATAWDDLILVGVVARTHGIRGQVIVNPHTDFIEERFRVGAVFQVRLAGGTRRTAEVTAVRVHQGRPIIAIDGVATMTDAEGWAGAELRIEPSAQGTLEPGRYYHHELVGCEVVLTGGEPVGRVVAVEGQTGQSRLVVNGPRQTHEIPLVDAICQVDVAARRITITPPDGLLDL